MLANLSVWEKPLSYRSDPVIIPCLLMTVNLSVWEEPLSYLSDPVIIPWLLMIANLSVWEEPLLFMCLLIVSTGFPRQGVQMEQASQVITE